MFCILHFIIVLCFHVLEVFYSLILNVLNSAKLLACTDAITVSQPTGKNSVCLFYSPLPKKNPLQVLRKRKAKCQVPVM